MHGWSLEQTAERFDEPYTRMTTLQRRLLAAARTGDEEDPSVRALVDEARAVIAACDNAGRSLKVGYDAREVETRALRARVLRPPLDAVLIMAAARSLTRPYGYPLLADALDAGAGDEAAENTHGGETLWGERTVLDVLAAPQGMGAHTARRVAEHLGIAPDMRVADLDEASMARLIDGLREVADALPETVAPAAGRRAKLPADASGAGRDLLERWVSEVGAATDPVRQAARHAAQRDGWPADGVPVAEVLVRFTDEQVMPLIVPDWGVLAGEPDLDQRIAGMRSESRAYLERWRSTPGGDAAGEEASPSSSRSTNTSTRCGRSRRPSMASMPPEQWRTGSSLSHARAAARRCGEILALVDESAIELLDRLPPSRAEDPATP